MEVQIKKHDFIIIEIIIIIIIIIIIYLLELFTSALADGFFTGV